MLAHHSKILVVGAGPAGLSAALFLTKKGLKPRIIDKLSQPSVFSKALGVNPRTLELFESTGATEAFLNNGYKLQCFNFYKNNKIILKNSFSNVKHKYPFMLFQAQAESESILAKLLAENGVAIERNVEFLNASNADKKVKVSLKHENETVEDAVFDIVFAADGLKSSVRRYLGLKMIGTQYDKPWYLCDAEVDTDLSPIQAHAFLHDDFVIAVLRIKDKTWRIISNKPYYIQNLPNNVSIKKITWKSEFHIHHKIIERLNVGNIYFGGDAAHVHSPLGGRGMNLGIEDAYVFTNLLVSDRLNEYHDRRYKILKDLVKRINLLTNMLRGETSASKYFFKFAPYILPALMRFSVEKNQQFIMGLDHSI